MSDDPKKTLRDEFAMSALIAMGLPPGDMMMGNAAITARKAYAWADEMMDARKCPQDQLSLVKHRTKL